MLCIPIFQPLMAAEMWHLARIPMQVAGASLGSVPPLNTKVSICLLMSEYSVTQITHE